MVSIELVRGEPVVITDVSVNEVAAKIGRENPSLVEFLTERGRVFINPAYVVSIREVPSD